MSVFSVAVTRPNTDALTMGIRQALPEFTVVGEAVTEQLVDTELRDKACNELNSQNYDWLCLTSPTAVKLLLQAKPVLPVTTKVACVGVGTARAFTDNRWQPTLVGPGSGGGLVHVFPPAAAKTTGRVLLPCSAGATNTVEEGLAAKGWQVRRINLYTTHPVATVPPCYATADIIAATAASTIEALAKFGVWNRPKPPRLVTIGQPSLRFAHQLGIDATAAKTPNVDGFVAAISAIVLPR